VEVDVCHLVAVNALQLRHEVLLLRVEILKVFKAGALCAVDFVQIVYKEALAAD
jgi:hypothetical protein